MSYTSWLMAISAIWFIALMGLATEEKLPGQSADIDLEVTPYTHTFTNGDHGIRVRVRFGPKEFGGPLPKSFSLFAVFNDGFQNDWRVIEPRGYVGDPALKKEMDPHPALLADRDVDADEAICLLDGLEPMATYTIDFHLRPRKRSAEPESAIASIKKDRTFRIVFRAR